MNSRAIHPRLSQPLTLEQYLALPHVVLGSPSNARPMIDLALAKRRMAQLYAGAYGLQQHELPIHTPRFPVVLV